MVLLLVAGCGGPSRGAEHAGGAAPPEITVENLASVERSYWRLAPDDPSRPVWRDALIAHHATRTDEVLARGDYDEVVRHTASLTALLHPHDFETGSIPAGLEPLATWIVAHGAPRGDEGRVMAAHLLLAMIGEDADAHRDSREQIARWGREARAPISNPVERFGGLIQVWEQHEELAPAPEVLEALARLYLEQREGLVRAFGPGGEGGRPPSGLSFQHLRLAPLLIQRAPLDVAAVYLRHGDLESAIEEVGRMGDQSGVERQLVRLLERAREDNAGGAEALGELSQGFSGARPSVAWALCTLGARRFPDDARFPVCLARTAMEREQASAAVAWYDEAVRLAPDERAVYDEALARLGDIIERGALVSDVEQARAIGSHALHILEERDRRWPEAADTHDDDDVRRESLLLHLGRAEMTAGHVDEARARLEASLAARETPEAHRYLGLLLERVGDPEGAAVHYRAALDETTDREPRAQLQEWLGDAFRHAGQAAQARRMYEQALAVWTAVLDGQVAGPRRAHAEVRRGILLSRLGRRADSAEAFGRAMEAAPTWREAYAEILSHLVVSDPNVELAQTVLRRAQYQLTLEPEWRVYFALWVQAVAARASTPAEADVGMLLHELASGDAWSNRLAAFGRDSLEYPELRELASTRGQRTEADFYEAARRLGAGDVAGARELLRQVLESHMVSFFEYAMAQELLAQLDAGSPVVAQ